MAMAGLEEQHGHRRLWRCARLENAALLPGSRELDEVDATGRQREFAPPGTDRPVADALGGDEGEGVSAQTPLSNRRDVHASTCRRRSAT